MIVGGGVGHVVAGLLLFLTIRIHHLLQAFIKLIDVSGEFFVAQDLLHQLLLIFFPDESAFDSQSFISNLLSTIIRYLFIPLAAITLRCVALDLKVSFFQSHFPDFSYCPLCLQELVVQLLLFYFI